MHFVIKFRTKNKQTIYHLYKYNVKTLITMIKYKYNINRKKRNCNKTKTSS